MTQALFYLMPDNHNQMSALDALHLAACRLAEQHYRQQKTVYIHCKDKQQAYAIDELLWQFEPSAFVPHNLKGEGPMTGAPVEIGFDTLGPNKSRIIKFNGCFLYRVDINIGSFGQKWHHKFAHWSNINSSVIKHF